jgi:hypothetical protein
VSRFSNITAATRNVTVDNDARFAFGLDHLVYALGNLHSHRRRLPSEPRTR